MPLLHDVDTGIYNQSMLSYPVPGGMSALGQSGPYFYIPITLTAYTPATSAAQINNIPTIPLILSSDLVIGTNATGQGSTPFPRITLEGFTDSPTEWDGEYRVPAIYAPGSTSVGTLRMTWGEFFLTCFEGRANYTYQRVEPVWFRDPYGRQFNAPKVTGCTASYVEAVPGRTNFTMELLIT